VVRPTVCISDVPAIKEYATKRVFDALRSGMYRTTLCADDQSMSVSKQWPVGRKYILMHLFGWRKLATAKPGVMDLLNLVTGHFAFGFAEIVKDRFTGEPRWDIEYKQVYGHNREEVVSGSIKWHAYMGNLRRGWMYSIPVADTIIDIPELQPYKINGKTINPMRGLARELEKMMAKYRVGSGSGCSMVRPDVSCVQDSHCALNSGLYLLINGLGKQPDIIAWQKTGSAEAQRFQALKELGRDVEKTITSFGTTQGNWKEFIATPFGTRNPEKVRALVNSIKSIRTVFPRGAYDHLMSLSAKKGYSMWTILTCQIGGVIPGLVPQKPTSLIGHK
jgi:predicted Abi (CAAX) family protease